MAVSQGDKAERFRALHQGPGAFVIANPWDAGSARILAGLGFAALATSSGASAGMLGRRDGKVTRDGSAGARAGDRGGDRPAGLGRPGEGFRGHAERVPRRPSGWPAEVGLVGGSIEDATGDPARPLFDIGQATARVAAAVQAARALAVSVHPDRAGGEFPAREPGSGRHDRAAAGLRAAGADVLFAPGLPDLTAVRAVCAAVSKPFNFMAGIKGKSFTVAELAAAGVKRISLAHLALSRGDDRACSPPRGR